MFEGTLIHQVDLGLVVIDRSKRIVLWNLWMSERAGIGADLALGRPLDDVFPELAGGRIVRAVEDALSRGQARLLTPALTRAGFPLRGLEVGGGAPLQRISVQAIKDARGERACLVQVADVTAAVQRERQLLRQAEELRVAMDGLEQARLAAEQANAAKSRFLASMSHELRTPLNAVIGFAQLLQNSRRDPLSATQSEFVNFIVEGGEVVLRLIDDVLNLARIEAGRLHLEMAPYPLAKIIETVAGTLRPLADKAGLRMCADTVPPDLDVTIDKLRLVQVLYNLGSNAIKYNRPGGWLAFAVTYPTAGTVRIEVRDGGIGIPPDKQGRLFQAFDRLGQERGTIEGTGIGLVISRQLIELMDGRIGYAPLAAGEGSVFWIDLPIRADTEAASGKTVPVSLDDPFSELVGRTILYVEDNPIHLRLLSGLIATFPESQLQAAETGEHGLALALRSHPDVIVTDINLPGMDGIALCHALAENPETADIPVIALTADVSPETLSRARAAGFAAVLAKPLDVSALTEALAQACRRRPG